MNDNALIITILIIIAIAVLFVMVASSQKQEKQKTKSRMLNTLEALKAGAFSDDLARRRDTIIKLDNVLSKSLQYRLSNTKLCGDNLKLVGKRFKKEEYNRLWEVHKLRNKIVHDDLDVTENEAQDAYKIYNMSIHRILQ
jgi:type II secretory pathway pseudopilin PulG